LRITDTILEAVDEVARPRGAACDLFAGSGTVSLALSRVRPVTAVDIQEYSRVVCSALLAPVRAPARPDAAWIVDTARRSEVVQKLREAVEPLINLEQQCLASAAAGDLEPLCDFLEHASLLALDVEAKEQPSSEGVRKALRAASNNLTKAGLRDDSRSIVTRYFGGIYFSVEQAVELDGLLDVVHALPSEHRDYFLSMVLSTASEIVNTVGKQFAQPIRPRDSQGRPKRHLAQQVIRDRARVTEEVFAEWSARYEALPAPTQEHATYRADYRDFLRTATDEFSVVYADPPYTRDHYSRFYHVLETMCLRDNPAVSTMRLGDRELLSRGFYRSERHQSPFCIKTQAPGAFTELFEGVRRLKAPLVLSYSPYQASEGARPRLMTIDGIVELARKSFNNVEVRSVGKYAHNKFNQQERNARMFYDSEVLVICTS